MTTDEEMFKSDTKDSPEDVVFNSRTRDHPHRITFIYSLDLSPSIVQRFPTETIRKPMKDRVWFARDPNADVCLFDKDFPRNCMELKCLSGENGEMVVIVKNLSEKKLLELKIPDRDKVSLGLNQKSRIETHTVFSISLMPLIAIFQNGDICASYYEVSMNGLDSQSFNSLMLSTSANRTSGNRTSLGLPPTQAVPFATNRAESSFGYPPLPACPDLSISWPTNSFSSQTRPKQFYQSTPFSQNFNPVNPHFGVQHDANIRPVPQPCFCGLGARQGNIITSPESCQCGSQGYINLHQREYDRSNSCPVCNPSIVPCIQPGGQAYYSQANHHGAHQRVQRCSSDSQRMLPPPDTNWHNHTPPGGLPTAPPIRDNYVNTHPYSEITPHDFNVNLISEYTNKN